MGGLNTAMASWAASLAQLVQHRSRACCVMHSSPTCGSLFLFGTKLLWNFFMPLLLSVSEYLGMRHISYICGVTLLWSSVLHMHAWALFGATIDKSLCVYVCLCTQHPCIWCTDNTFSRKVSARGSCVISPLYFLYISRSSCVGWNLCKTWVNRHVQFCTCISVQLSIICVYTALVGERVQLMVRGFVIYRAVSI